MKRLMLMVLALGAAFASFADTYDERLEFIETTGTQWIDTGLKLHFRNSKYRLHTRVLDYPASSEVLFAGVTEIKDSVGGWIGGDARSFGVGALPRKADNRVLVQYTTCSNQDSYTCPGSGDYTLAQAYCLEGQHHEAWFNSSSRGYYDYASRKPNRACNYSFFIGACNNAGAGLICQSASAFRVHWYGAQFWTDGVLVGDFIPAKKDGVAGFWDRVTETFFASIGTEDFIAPERITWKGANDATLTDGANWVGGYAPTNYEQVAVFPAGATNRYVTADINGFFNKIGGANLVGADTLLWLTNNTVSGTYCHVPLFGKGTFRVERRTDDSVSLHLCADNCLFEGLIDILSCYTYVDTPFCLGEAGVGKAIYRVPSFNNTRLRNASVTLYCDLQLQRTGQFCFLLNSTFAGKVSMAGYNPGFHANNTDKTTFACEMSGDADAMRKLELTSGRYSVDNPATTKNLGRTRIFVGNWFVNAPLAFTRQPQDPTIVQQCNVNLTDPDATATSKWNVPGTIFGYTNALDDATFLLMCNAKISGRPTRIVDLNGYDQRVGILAVNVLNDSNQAVFDAATTWNANNILKSDAPAKLTILETFRDDANDGTAANCGIYPGVVKGALSIVLADNEIVDPGTWAKKMRFNCPGSDTTGSLTAQGGFIEIMPTATFSNLTALAAQKTGVVKVGTADVGNATNLVVSVTDATTAKIEIADGVTLKADTAQMGDGRWLEAGKYSSVASEGVRVCKYLSGTGVLEVSRYGGKRGCVFFLR